VCQIHYNSRSGVSSRWRPWRVARDWLRLPAESYA
jgi:hypothetical protein